MYTAVVLTNESRKALLDAYGEMIDSPGFQQTTKQGEPLTHHVTLNMGDIGDGLNPAGMVGREIVMEVLTLGADERAIAFGVEFKEHPEGAMFGTPLVYTKNKIPHITGAINLNNGGKPFHSNQIAQWDKLPTPVEIRGVVEVVN